MSRRQSRITGPRDATPLGPLDPRDHAWRPDLADLRLAPLLAVPNYVAPQPRQALRATAMRAAASADSPPVSELLPGEGFAVLDRRDGFFWGQSLLDGYVGYVQEEALALPAEGAAAIIGPGDAQLFVAPDLKAPAEGALPLGSRVVPEAGEGPFLRLSGHVAASLYVHRRHLLFPGRPRPDWVDVALQFQGSPYRWGGRSRQGVDCSGLIQIARQVAGLFCRRDSDMIFADAAECGAAGHDGAAAAPGQRGDLAWWPGHIGILLGDGQLLHANAHHQACVIESLAAVIARAGAGGGDGQPRIRRPGNTPLPGDGPLSHEAKALAVAEQLR